MKAPSTSNHGRKIGCIVTMLFVLGIIICLIIMLAARVDHYKFLDGNKPIFGGVAYNFHGSSFGLDYSAYSWEENYIQVLSKAEAELLPLGFEIELKKDNQVTWHRGDDVYIEIMSGRSYDKRDFWGPKRKDPQWVTVHVILPGEDTWANHLRYSLERDHKP